MERKVTKRWIKQNATTTKGVGWTDEMLSIFGLSNRTLTSGWMDSISGTDISEENAALFERLGKEARKGESVRIKRTKTVKAIPQKKVEHDYSWVKTDDPDFKRTMDLLLDSSGPNMCIMGCGGSGKSTLLKMAYDKLPGTKIVTASTGVAAANLSLDGVPASTLHSALRIGAKEWYDTNKIGKDSVKVLSLADVLFIDEISMVTDSLMDYVLEIAKRANLIRKKSGKSNVRIILFGDVCQLPPVVKEDSEVFELYRQNYDGKIYFFNALRYKNYGFEDSLLYKVYRQDENEKLFIKALDEVRTASVCDCSLDFLNTRVCSLNDFAKEHDSFLFVVSTNKLANYLNQKYEDKFKGKPMRTYKASYEKLTSDSFPTVLETVNIYEGQRVMTLANAKDGSYQNGSFGRVTGFSAQGNPIVMFQDGHSAEVKNNTWENYTYTITGNKVVPTLKGTCTQIACKAAFAVTFHKVQSLTLDAVYINVSSGFLAPSSLYIGLSRVRNIKNLGLSHPITKDRVFTHPEALEFISGKWKENRKTDSEQELLF